MEIIDRLKADLHPFWIKVRKIAIWATSTSGVLLAADGQGGLKLPETLSGILSHIVIAGIVLGLSAQLTKNDDNNA